MPTMLITGANRGLGLEFVRQYAAEGWNITACCRQPGAATELQDIAAAGNNVTIEALEVTDHAQIEALARTWAARPLDVLLNNAGIIGPIPIAAHLERQHFGTLDYGVWDEVIHTNTYGPIKMAEAFLENVAISDQKKIVTLSSTVGSITEHDAPAYAYATSKTALNKAMTLLSNELRSRGIIVTLLCPGYTKTRMDLGGATVEVVDSVAGMRKLIAQMTLADSGTFARYNGERIAW